MHFMRDNLLDTEDVDVAPADAGKVFDGLFDNYHEFISVQLTVTFTFPSPVSFQRIWLKTEDVVSWTAVSGTSTIASVSEIGDGEVSSFHSVVVTNQRAITFEFTRKTGGMSGKVFEIMLMPLLFDLDSSQRPMRFEVIDGDPGSEAYRTEDGEMVAYSGLSEGKATILIGWDYMPKAFTDQLRRLWKGPPLRRPFIIYPEPDDNPDDIFMVRWQNQFRRVPTGESLLSGYTVNAVLEEM